MTALSPAPPAKSADSRDDLPLACLEWHDHTAPVVCMTLDAQVPFGGIVFGVECATTRNRSEESTSTRLYLYYGENIAVWDGRPADHVIIAAAKAAEAIGPVRAHYDEPETLAKARAAAASAAEAAGMAPRGWA